MQKKLHLRCFTGFWIHLWLIVQSLFFQLKYQKNFGKEKRNEKVSAILFLRRLDRGLCNYRYDLFTTDNSLGSFVSQLNIVFFSRMATSNSISKLRFRVLLRIQIWNFISKFVVKFGLSFPTSYPNKNSERKLGIRVQIVSRNIASFSNSNK